MFKSFIDREVKSFEQEHDPVLDGEKSFLLCVFFEESKMPSDEDFFTFCENEGIKSFYKNVDFVSLIISTKEKMYVGYNVSQVVSYVTSYFTLLTNSHILTKCYLFCKNIKLLSYLFILQEKTTEFYNDKPADEIIGTFWYSPVDKGKKYTDPKTQWKKFSELLEGSKRLEYENILL